MNCPHCGETVVSNAICCIRCGYKFENTKKKYCMECGMSWGIGAKICPNCGSKLYSADRIERESKFGNNIKGNVSKNKIKIIIAFCVLLVLGIMLTLSLFTKTKNIKPDYSDEYYFEQALNSGEDVVGKIVCFTADDIRTNTLWGYNIWSGEHLNFVSDNNPKINVGDTVTVKINKVNKILGSWIIEYEKIK